MHYPQIRVSFSKELTVAEKSDIAQKLNNSKIAEFSIDGDYFIVSLLDFDSETRKQKLEKYEEKRNAIAALFGGDRGENREGGLGIFSKSNRKSKYVGARNEGDEQSQSREYDRSDLFETHASQEAGTRTIDPDLDTPMVQAMATHLQQGVHTPQGVNGKSYTVLITPATIRAFDQETSRLKGLTDEYNKVASEISVGNLTNKVRFEELQSEILDKYAQYLAEKIAKIRGVEVSFKSPYLGAWQGNYEPSLNMTLKISDNADTGALSGLLFDMAENTSQDAFILETKSDITDRTPLTEFDDDGFTHYPQIRISFNQELTVEEKSEIAQKLNNSKIAEFSIDGDYFIVSLIDFESETEQQKIENYEKKRNTIATLFVRERGKNREDRFGVLSENNRKSKYVGARNEGDEISQTREYDRSDLFETHASQEAGTRTIDPDLNTPMVQAMAVFRESPQYANHKEEAKAYRETLKSIDTLMVRENSRHEVRRIARPDREAP